jgi:hypothetical protein
MKKYICILASAALLAACEQKTETTESPTVTSTAQEPRGTSNSSTIVILLVLFGAGLAIFLIIAQRRTIKNRRIEPVPKPLIPVPTAPSETSPDSRSIFVSYRRLDSADITGRIYDRLVQHFGKASIFKDVDSIPLGIDFRKHLQNSVGQCSVLLAIIGKNWLAAADKGKPRLNDAKDHLRIELETALQRDIPIIPVLVQGATVPE